MKAGVLLAALFLAAASAAAQQGAPAPVGVPTPRDPFRPFNVGLRPMRAEPPKTPLEKYSLAELTLVAVIYDTANPKAMVEDASRLGYTVSIGTPIGNANGVVKTIEPDRIVVEEEFVDFYNEKKKTDTVLRLKPEGEKRP